MALELFCLNSVPSTTFNWLSYCVQMSTFLGLNPFTGT